MYLASCPVSQRALVIFETVVTYSVVVCLLGGRRACVTVTVMRRTEGSAQIALSLSRLVCWHGAPSGPKGWSGTADSRRGRTSRVLYPLYAGLEGHRHLWAVTFVQHSSPPTCGDRARTQEVLHGSQPLASIHTGLFHAACHSVTPMLPCDVALKHFSLHQRPLGTCYKPRDLRLDTP